MPQVPASRRSGLGRRFDARLRTVSTRATPGSDTTEDATAGDTDDRQLVAGWEGRFYEDFAVGDVYKHPFGRRVTERDNAWLTNLTMTGNPMHCNEHSAAATEFGERLVDGLVVIALAVGMSVIDPTMNATANLSDDDGRHHAPVFHGDTLFAESEIVATWESDSRDYLGIVTAELRADNQEDDLGLTLDRTFMVLKRSEVEPTPTRPTGWPEDVGTQPTALD